MRNKKYHYNKQTLRYEEVKVSLGSRILRATSVLIAVLVSATVLAVLVDTYLPSQKERALMREIDEMRYQYTLLTDEMHLMSEELTTIQDRDAKIHRFVFDMDPIEESVWTAGVGGSDYYSGLSGYANAGETMVETHRQMDKLERQLMLQRSSLDTLEMKAEERADRFRAIPSIKPVRVDLLARNVTLLSGYGMRMHPIHKVRKMHEGIDFTAPSGTAIQATGKGKVITSRKSRSGFGHHVIIDHGYGYQTIYAHMDEIHVKVGDLVDKGQQIGTVGNTGTSTAPHCHYEVVYKGKKVDPIHYCLDGLTPDQYSEIVKRATKANQSFD